MGPSSTGEAAEVLRSVDDGGLTWSEWHWSGTGAGGTPFAARGVTLCRIVGGSIVAGRLDVEEVEQAPVGIDDTVAMSLTPRRSAVATTDAST